MDRKARRSGRPERAATVLALSLTLLVVAAGAAGQSLRTSSLGNCGIALADPDNGINPYDFGHNAAFMLRDFEYPWIRFVFGLEEESGDLKRLYDPHLVNDFRAGFTGIKMLSDRQAAKGSFTYGRRWEREIHRALEYDQYNDPFYLMDETTGDFEYYGPSIQVDYSLRLRPRLSIGLGLDYEISTGLKQEYTRPEIVHNSMRAHIGAVFEASDRWVVGMVLRPERLQNRTNFERPDEGYDNVITPFFGDGIYEIRSFSSYTITELEDGAEGAVQGFYLGDELQVGAVAAYGFGANEIKYSATLQTERGYWQNERFDAELRARYLPPRLPIVLGVQGRYVREDGWAKRPEYEEILLYENPVEMLSAGAGLSWRIEPANALLSLEYVMNMYDIEASDYGASEFRALDVVQNIGRIGVEYSMFNVYSIRGGFEYTDYLVDRWIKLPSNADRLRFSGGLGYNVRLWSIDVQLLYSTDTKDDYDASRRGLSGILWFTRLMR